MPVSAWVLFLGGVGTLLFSASALVRVATAVAARWKLSPLIIGTTIVALGTSLPELAVSLTAAVKGDEALALGNILGSNTTNLLLVLPLAIVLSPIRIGTTKTQRNALIMLSLTGLFAWMLLYFWNAIAGFVLLAGGVTFSVAEYRWGVYGRKHEDKQQLKLIKKAASSAYLVLAAALAGVIAGGYLTVVGAEGVARDLGWSTNIIGLTLVALATSLPEIVVTALAGVKKQAKLAVGNILGSNIYNILLIGGSTAIITKPIPHQTQGLIWFGATAILMTGLLKFFRGKNIPRQVGLGMLVAYGIYLVLMVTGER